MSDNKPDSRMVWSCSLYRPPEEEESDRLAEQLRDGSASFWEDALALHRYIELTGLSQSAAARELRRSQSGVANRLRLLKLSPEVRDTLRRYDLTERHARALLRVRDEQTQREALEVIVKNAMTVAQTEAYLDGLAEAANNDAPVPEAFAPLLAELQKLRAVLPGVRFDVQETDDDILLSVRISKKYDS